MKCMVKRVVCLVVGLCALQIDASDKSSGWDDSIYVTASNLPGLMQRGVVDRGFFNQDEISSLHCKVTLLEDICAQQEKKMVEQQRLLTIAQTAIQELQKQMEIARQGKSDSLTDAMAAVSLKQ